MSTVKRQASISQDTEEKIEDEQPPLPDVYKLGLRLYEPRRFRKTPPLQPLPRAEMQFYVIYVYGGLLYNFWRLYLDSNDDVKKTLYMEDGWKWLGRPKDSTDNQWDLWMFYYKTYFAVYVIHVVLSLFLRRFLNQYWKHGILLFSVIALTYVYGWQIVLYELTIMTSIYLVSSTGSVLATWITGISWLIAENIYEIPEIYIQFEHFYHLHSFVISNAFLICRVISYGVERSKRKNGSSTLPDTITFTGFDALFYTFYLPNYFYGPVFIYKFFQIEITKPHQPWTLRELTGIIRDCIRRLFWMLFLDFTLHFFYVDKIAHSVQFLNKASSFSMIALLLAVNGLYHTKYVVIYGLANCVMRMDRIIAPSQPRCPCTIGHFSDMWSAQDPGLQAFFHHYIYVPLGGSRHGILRQVVATFITFAFVGVYHGMNSLLIVAPIINFAVVLRDSAATKLCKNEAFVNWLNTYMSLTMQRRLRNCLNLPFFAVSVMAILMVHTDVKPGFIIVYRYFAGGLVYSIWTSIGLFFFLILTESINKWCELRMQSH